MSKCHIFGNHMLLHVLLHMQNTASKEHFLKNEAIFIKIDEYMDVINEVCSQIWNVTSIMVLA